MGVTGAAIATVAAEYIELIVMLIVLGRSSKVRPHLGFPPWSDSMKLINIWLPLAVNFVCKGSCYLAIQWAASCLKVIELAAHQAMYAWWNMLAFSHTPVLQCALAYIPAGKGKDSAEHLCCRISAA